MTPFFVSPRRMSVAAAQAQMALPPLQIDPSVEALMAQTSTFCYSIDYRTGRFRYIGPGLDRLLGFNPQAWHFHGPRKVFKHVHPEDQSCVERICAEIRRELRFYPPRKRHLLSFAFTCRTADAQGKYLHLYHQITFPHLDKQGNPITDFCVVTDITALQSPHPCMLHVRRNGSRKTETLRTQVFTCLEEVEFSRRELEVLRLVAEGCNSQEISERLFISYNTVCSHRKNLLRKAGVNRTVDLLRFARGLGLVG